MTHTEGQTGMVARPDAGFLRRRIGGLPRPFWVLWTGTLANRIGRPALGLTRAALCAVAAVGQVGIGPAIRRRSRPA